MSNRYDFVPLLANLLWIGTSFANGSGEVAIGLHVRSATAVSPCTVPGLTRNVIVESSPVLSLGPGGPFSFVYVFACNGTESSGVSGLDFGIQYAGAYSPSGGSFPLNVFSWHLCADSNTPDGTWPASATGNLIEWNSGNCQTTRSEAGDPGSVIAVSGYLYVGAYMPTTLYVVQRPGSGLARVLECNGNAVTVSGMFPSRLGAAGFGGAGGYNPCIQGIIPAEQTTWGSVKSGHRR